MNAEMGVFIDEVMRSREKARELQHSINELKQEKKALVKERKEKERNAIYNMALEFATNETMQDDYLSGKKTPFSAYIKKRQAYYAMPLSDRLQGAIAEFNRAQYELMETWVICARENPEKFAKALAAVSHIKPM